MSGPSAESSSVDPAGLQKGSRTPDSSALARLRVLTDQLWPASEGDGLRVVLDPIPDPGWIDVEGYRIFPSTRRPALALPLDRRVARRALLAYSGLRDRRRGAIRQIVGHAVGLGLPLARRTLVLQRAAGRDPHRPCSVLTDIEAGLGLSEVTAMVSVRTSANRKVTLQIVDGRGAPVGFAKTSWSVPSAAGVRAEAAALSEVSGGGGAVRFPSVLLTGEYGGYPYLVTSPLPADLRFVPADARLPSPLEFAALAPVVRRAPASDSGHVRSLRQRFDALPGDQRASELGRAVGRCLELMARDEESVPISARCHGDFAFWNVGRLPDGTLWTWDLESSERDALAGLDVLHWVVSSHRSKRRAVVPSDVAAALDGAGLHLRAIGVAPQAWPVLVLTYVVDVALRAIELASTQAGWAAVWISPRDLSHMVTGALTMHDATRSP